MNDRWSSLLQGIVEGLTEFLPVSSTAHILLTQEALGTDRTAPFWKMFAVVIQLGAILSVIVYFRKRILEFLASFQVAWKLRKTDRPESESTRNKSDATNQEANEASFPAKWYKHPLVLILLSFVVTAVPCFLADEFIGDRMEDLRVIAYALLIGAVVMVVVDKRFSSKATTHRLEEESPKQAIAIGIFQILAAAFPGTSRSMATIVGGQVFGLSRTAALEFSFFLAIPVMLAAAGFKLLQHLMKHSMPSSADWLNLAIGFVTSFVVAYAVIAWFMNWVRSRGFIPFAIYRVLLGLGLLWYLRK